MVSRVTAYVILLLDDVDDWAWCESNGAIRE
jgi:hypothetical protein